MHTATPRAYTLTLTLILTLTLTLTLTQQLPHGPRTLAMTFALTLTP